jgi:hypothetical protein
MSAMKNNWADRWKGRTVVCIASGPSLTAEDCETVHAAGHPTIVTNTTFRLCLWADVLFAFDSRWWKASDDESKRLGFKSYADESAERFKGERVTTSLAGKSMGLTSMHGESWFEPYGNSGTAAVSLALIGGASRVVLLGYDCQRTGGKAHWHGDHPPMLGNAGSIASWPKKFANLAKRAGDRVVNCSRATSLTCFPRMDLKEAL